MTDTEIIRLYQCRSERAVKESDIKYGAYCFAVADNILCSREDSDECVNDTWLRTWNVIPPQCPERLKLFFAKITRNLALDRIKRNLSKKRGGGQLVAALDELEECISGGNHVDDAVDEKLLGECIEAFLRGIPKRDRQFFLRRYFYTETVTDIASRFKVSVNTVSVSLSRTRGKLKEHLEKEGFFV